MKTAWKTSAATAVSRWIRQSQGNLLWIGGAGASAALILISCATSGRTMMAPPSIPGATFVGSSECSQCHEKTVRDFKTADHARLQAKGKNAVDMGCESCHGPGSKHVESGGGAGTIVNPNKSPETCFQCHLDKKGEFSLPYAHPVLSGKMSCTDCHDPHKGGAIKGGGTQLHGNNETCAECHKAQTQHFIFSHDAVKEGCSTCHNPHGSVNQKMLTERNATLCLKCHFDSHTGFRPGSPASSGQMGPSGNHGPTGPTVITTPSSSATVPTNRFNQGTCWSAGCHEAVHGSNTNVELRF
jgi:DmsE family decaheme c-type cytochrome